MAKSTKTVSRRTFLRSSMAAGVVLSLPWLPGCGDGSDDASSPPPELPEGRKHSNLHFDLSHVAHSGPYVLHAIGSAANKSHLTPHTAATRARDRRNSRRLQGVSDAHLTHYASNVDLPTRAVQHIWVSAGTGPSARPVLSKIVCGTVDPSDPNTWVSPRDMALAMVFHHNEIARLDPDQAAIVCAHIDSSFLDGLAEVLTHDDSLVEMPVTDLNGAPVLDSKGEQLVQFDPSDEVLVVADAVVRDVLERIFDDPELKDANWHAASGRTTVTVPTTDKLAVQAAETFEASYQADANYRSSAHGVYFTGLTLIDPEKRTVELEVKNFWLRWLSAYIDFFSPSGAVVESTAEPFQQGSLDFDIFNLQSAPGTVVRSRFVSIVGANSDFLGIPVLPEDTAATPLRFDMPPGASVARVSFLTLGLGGPGYSVAPHEPGNEFEPLFAFGVPCGLTLLFNIGVPAFLLASAVGTDPTAVASFASVARDKKLWLQLSALIPLSILKSMKRDDARPFLLTFGSKLVSLALKTLPAFAERLIAYLGLEEAEQAVPIVGWGVKMASISAATAKLGQTVGEVLSSPPLFENSISLTLTTRLTIAHDPHDPAGFPATATYWVAHASYDGKLGRRLEGELPSALTDPIDVEFQVPSGGTGKIDVWFLTDTNWIAGHGTTGDFANLAGAAGVLTQSIAITENLVPITATTKYHHRQKLAISNGRHVWQAAPNAAPTQTAADLVCDDNGLCDLNGITLSETSAIAGYSWQGRNATLPVCGAGPTNSPVHVVQNVSFTQRPDDGLKRALCGYRAKPLLAYQLSPRPGQLKPLNFYLDPSGAAGGYHLRSVSLDTTPFDQTSQMSWGQFSQEQNAIAIHPSGYAVGINTQFHKLEILRLPKSPAPDDAVAASVLKAGRGTRVGLLDTPHAVGVDLSSGAIYVLEGGNGRIQAFDVHGNALARFKGGTSEIRLLKLENDATYLDMAVESTGLIYVLSFVGDGRNAADYRLDIYDPDSMDDTYLSRTTGVAAGKMAVDLWRNVFTLNYEPIIGPTGVEPSLSEWIPSTPDSCDPATNPFCGRF
jgi:hypothetical protein